MGFGIGLVVGFIIGILLTLAVISVVEGLRDFPPDGEVSLWEPIFDDSSEDKEAVRSKRPVTDPNNFYRRSA